MKTGILLIVLLSTTTLIAAPAGFTSIYDGETPTGWKGPVENYSFTNGIIQCRPKKGGTIYTEKKYTDFVLHFEFKLPPGGNNGLAIRYPGFGDTAYKGMCELQVLDDTAPKYAKLDSRQYHGSAYGMVAAKRGFLNKTGEWNTQIVEVVGSTIKVTLNGSIILDTDLALVTDYLADKPHPGKMNSSGHFGFAGHSSPVAFRKIYIKELTHE